MRLHPAAAYNRRSTKVKPHLGSEQAVVEYWGPKLERVGIDMRAARPVTKVVEGQERGHKTEAGFPMGRVELKPLPGQGSDDLYLGLRLRWIRPIPYAYDRDACGVFRPW